MECGQCSPSRPFVVLPVDRFVGHGGSPLERQKQDSRVYRKKGTLPLIFRKNQSRQTKSEATLVQLFSATLNISLSPKFTLISR